MRTAEQTDKKHTLYLRAIIQCPNQLWIVEIRYFLVWNCWKGATRTKQHPNISLLTSSRSTIWKIQKIHGPHDVNFCRIDFLPCPIHLFSSDTNVKSVNSKKAAYFELKQAKSYILPENIQYLSYELFIFQIKKKSLLYTRARNYIQILCYKIYSSYSNIRRVIRIFKNTRIIQIFILFRWFWKLDCSRCR